jgi:hypothetical protein
LQNIVNIDTASKQAFLGLFPDSMKAHISNIFLGAVRQGAENPDRVLVDVMTSSLARLKTAERFNDSRDEVKFRLLLRVMDTHQDKARGFARYCTDWEALPPTQKGIVKAARAQEYRAQYLDSQPATEKQIKYLRNLGWSGDITSKQQASGLIEKYKSRLK